MPIMSHMEWFFLHLMISSSEIIVYMNICDQVLSVDNEIEYFAENGQALSRLYCITNFSPALNVAILISLLISSPRLILYTDQMVI